MSALIGHAKASYILADSFERQSGQCRDDAAARLLLHLSDAYRHAAREMDDAMRQEATAWTPPPPSDGLGK